MLKKLGQILTYHDSEPTEIIQGLIWFIFAPIVLFVTYDGLWFISILSIIVGFGTLYSVVYESLKIRKYFGFLYGFMAILFTIIFFWDKGLSSNAMNWGWVVISISALSNIRRIQQKIDATKKEKKTTDIEKMYREELQNTIKEKQKENFKLRIENIRLTKELDNLK